MKIQFDVDVISNAPMTFVHNYTDKTNIFWTFSTHKENLYDINWALYHVHVIQKLLHSLSKTDKNPAEPCFYHFQITCILKYDHSFNILCTLTGKLRFSALWFFLLFQLFLVTSAIYHHIVIVTDLKIWRKLIIGIHLDGCRSPTSYICIWKKI